MSIIPASIEEQINRVDPQRSRYIGISLAVLAAWSAYRLIWAFYIAATVPWVAAGSLVFPFVLWGVIGVVAGIASVAFFARAKRT